MKKIEVMEIVSMIREKHLEADFLKFRNGRPTQEPIEKTLILYHFNKLK